MYKMKRILASILVAITILSCNVTGFAVTRPSVTYLKQSAATVKRGKKIKFYIALDSGSYKKKSGKWRAYHLFNINYKSPTGPCIYAWGTLFTGRTNSYYDWFQPSKSTKTGKYYWRVGVFYHKTGVKSNSKVNLNKWKLSDYDYTTFRIK